MSDWGITCADLGCENGKTIQGRKYHYDGEVEEQWAPCGQRADTCAPTPTPGDPSDGQALTETTRVRREATR